MRKISDRGRAVWSEILKKAQAEYSIIRRIDLAGQRFGRLLVQQRSDNVGRRTTWLCRCDCGTMKIALTEKLRSGQTRSCGCFRIEVAGQATITHGAKRGRKTPKEYKAWSHAKGRCYNARDPKYPIYGGRGIAMCDRWRDDFAAFFADMGTAPPGTTLDRLDVNGHYEPGNCRWATPREQANNTRKNVMVDFSGRRMTLKQVARAVNVKYVRLHELVRYRGLSVADAIAKMKIGA
jgi:hypothetical protein